MSNTVTLGGNPIEVSGTFPARGDQAPAFSLVGKDLADVTLASLAGKRKILNIFPSIVMLKRLVEQSHAEGLASVQTLSTMRGRDFLEAYGVAIKTGPLTGVSARAVVVLDENDRVLHSELVGEIANEPDYAAALAALGK